MPKELSLKEDCYYAGSLSPSDGVIGPVYKVVKVAAGYVVFLEVGLMKPAMGAPTVLDFWEFHEMVDHEVVPMWVRVEE